MPSYIINIVIAILGIIVGAAAGIAIGIAYRKKVAEAEIGSAEEQAKKILNEAQKYADTRKKEALLEAKEEILRNRNELERDIKERRAEISKLEKRAIQKEEQIDKKIETLEKKEEGLNARAREVEAKNSQISELYDKQLHIAEEISGYTVEQAKQYLIEKVEAQARHDAARRIIEIEQQLREDADTKAKNIISLAVQRLSSDYVADVTVSVVELPNDEMKGRIIGREGRNIRTLETLTGTDLIIDDTPEAITISSFDPIRREIARLTIEKLVVDGRIHPSRIEETIDKSTKEVEAIIKAEGERATFIVGVHGINHELVKILGRLKYRTSYGQNVLAHSIEVAQIAGMLASELGSDPVIAKRAGLLHDIGKASTHEVDGSHIQIGLDIAKKFKEGKEVLHAIESHHNDVEPTTITAILVSAADAISAARPGARRENLENYIKRLEKLEEIANSFKGVEKSFAIQAGREIRIIVKPEEISDDDMVMTVRDIVNKIEAELSYPGQIKVHLIRESRVIEYAK